MENDLYYATNNNYYIRYLNRTTKNIEFVKVYALDEKQALGTFTRLRSDYVDDSVTLLTRDEYREIRENMGLNPNKIENEELPEALQRFLKIHDSPEWRKHYASGGFDDY
jgi:hypothetical protein